jgi:hypothetical protein
VIENVTNLHWDEDDTKAFLISLMSGIVTAIIIVTVIRKIPGG